MRLKHGIDLGYCTNIHRGENWGQAFDGLKQYTDEVRKRVAPEERYGIGLRLSAVAAAELSADESLLDGFRAWMGDRDCYVFTINGFPYGTFHGNRVKEQVYVPDWTAPERLEYTNTLFDLVTSLSPEGEEVSVSTLPGSFKEFVSPGSEKEQFAAMKKHILACSEHIERLRDRTGRDIHLGMEPEPLGYFETSRETVEFFGRILDGVDSAGEERLLRNVGVNYDTCHLAVEFETPGDAIGRLRSAGLRISKVHLSSALRLVPEPASVERLAAFQDDIYLHQVIVAKGGQVTHRFRDLPEAMDWHGSRPEEAGDEWRVHFHVPIHSHPEAVFDDTRDHITGLLDLLSSDCENGRDLWCRHFEMETYTWEVLPEAMRSGSVVDQLIAEYDWCLGEFARRGMR